MFTTMFFATSLFFASPQEPVEQTTCFFEREESSGFYKICYYDCMGSTVAITIKSTQLCSLSIKQ